MRKRREEPPYKKLERRGEEIYDVLYEKGGYGLLSEIKECFEGAIAAAAAERRRREARRLRRRLDHIVEGYRRHFDGRPPPQRTTWLQRVRALMRSFYRRR